MSSFPPGVTHAALTFEVVNPAATPSFNSSRAGRMAQLFPPPALPVLRTSRPRSKKHCNNLGMIRGLLLVVLAVASLLGSANGAEVCCLKLLELDNRLKLIPDSLQSRRLPQPERSSPVDVLFSLVSCSSIVHIRRFFNRSDSERDSPLQRCTSSRQHLCMSLHDARSCSC